MRGRSIGWGVAFVAAVMASSSGCGLNTTFVYKPGGPVAGGPKLPVKVAVLPFKDGTEDFKQTGNILLSPQTEFNLVKGGIPSTVMPLLPELWSKLFADELAASGNFRAARFVYTRSEFPEADLWIDGIVLKAYWLNSIEARDRFALSFVARRGVDNEVVWERELARESNIPPDINKGCGLGLQCVVDKIHAEINRQMQAIFAQARADLVATLASRSGVHLPVGDVNPAEVVETPKEEIAGVGLELKSGDHALLVEKVLEGAPASRAGMQAGDKILSIDGKPIAGKAVADIVGRIRGVKGTSVTLSVLRAGWSEPRDFTIVRDVLRAGTSAPPVPESPEQTIERILKEK